MGFYFWKSFRAGPFRVNLSKSGVGSSFGVRGARVSTGPRGTYIHLGTHGFYYRKKIGGSTGKFPSDGGGRAQAEGLDTEPSAQHGEFIPSSNSEVVNDINSRMGQYTLTFVAIAICVCSICFWPLLILTIPIAVVLINIERGRRVTVLNYATTRQLQERIEKIGDAFDRLAQTHSSWAIHDSRRTDDWKRNAGANTVVERSRASIRPTQPPFIQTNVIVWGINFGSSSLLFFPDQLLFLNGGKYSAAPYDGMSFTRGLKDFTENELAPTDCDQVGS